MLSQRSQHESFPSLQEMAHPTELHVFSSRCVKHLKNAENQHVWPHLDSILCASASSLLLGCHAEGWESCIIFVTPGCLRWAIWDHRATKWFGLKESFEDHLVQPPTMALKAVYLRRHLSSRSHFNLRCRVVQ